MNRRQVLQNFAALGGGALLMTFVGCSKSDAAPAVTQNTGQGTPAPGGGTDDGNGMPALCSEGSEASYLNPGHGHTAIALTADELSAATAGVYTLMGGSHPHTFEITAEMFEALHAGEEVVVEDIEGHGHELGLACI